jgi:uncharacterized membrane protein YccC
VTTGSRVVDALRPTTPDIGAVARSLLGVLAMAAVAFAWDSGAAAVWAAGAAAIAGAIALQDSPGGRVPLVVVVSVQMSVAVFIGALAATHAFTFVGVVAVWCLAAGMQWALGNNAGLVAAAATALLVIAPPMQASVSSVVVPAVLAFAAGCVQAGLIAAWPPHRWRAQRDALTRAYRMLAGDVRRVDADRQASVDLAPMTWLRAAFVDSQASRRPGAYHGGYRLPERIMATLHALRGAEDDERDNVSRMLTAAAALLDAVADHSLTARRDVKHALTELDTAVASIDGTRTAAAQRFSQQLHEAAESRFPDIRRPDLISPFRAAAAVVRGHLTWTSPILRHAVRLSAATALAITTDRFAPIAHGSWIALTVLMVLRPETAHTYTRCVGRLGGLAAGVVVASVIEMLAAPAGSAAVVLAVLFLAMTYVAVRYGYIAASATLAAAVVFLLDIDVATSGASLEDRLFAIVIGGGLAVGVHVALPDHALTRLHQRAGELLKTEIDYAATVVKGYVHELEHPADALSTAWQRAFRSRAAFEAASGAARLDSPEFRKWLRSYRAALNAVTSACASLEGSLPAQPPDTLTPEFVAAVDDYVDALRGAPPNPATPWTVDIAALTAANQLVREQAAKLDADNGALRVLVAEVAAITRALSGIAVTREPSSAG